MSMWRCPHCATPQAETARCWVCHRSSTACATCRHFRRSIAAQLGYCGLDRQRRPLRGDEIRGCWEAVTAPPDEVPTPIRRSPPLAPELVVERTPVRKLEFVEVAVSGPASHAQARRDRSAGEGAGWPGGATADLAGEDEEATIPAIDGGNRTRSGVAAEPRWSLWGDAEG